MRRTAATAVLAGLCLSGCGGETRPAQVRVDAAAVTLPAVSGRPGAAYFRLETDGPAVRLLRVESPAAERIEIHESGMRPASPPALPRGEPVAFEPGGRHAMLFGLDPSLRPGGRLPLTFTFAGAPPVTVQAEVRRPGDVRSAR